MLKTKFETLRDIIKKEIVSGKYLPGMMLPTEGEFQKTYGVNHSTINKAVSSLSTEGFIKTKQRNGSIVLPVKKRRIAARLGVYVMKSSGHVFDRLNAEIQNVLQRNFYFPLLINLDYIEDDKNIDWLKEHLDEAIDSFPEFIIVDGQAGFTFDLLQKRHLEVQNLIFVNRFEFVTDIPSIKLLSDYEHGGYMAVKHLLDSGCRKPLIVLGSRKALCNNINISYLKIKGAKRAWSERGFDPASLVFLSMEDNDFLRELKDAFGGESPHDGIFSDSDFVAYKSLTALERMKIMHGYDYKLVGYFDTPWARETASPFDSISINQTGIALKLHEIISERNYEKRIWTIRPELKKYAQTI